MLLLEIEMETEDYMPLEKSLLKLPYWISIFLNNLKISVEVTKVTIVVYRQLKICIDPTICIDRESWCLPYAGFFFWGGGSPRISLLCIVGSYQGKGPWLLALVTGNRWQVNVIYDIWHVTHDAWHRNFYNKNKLLVLLFPHIERFSVSRMQDF